MIEWIDCTVKLGALKPWSDNPKTSSKKDARALLKSFSELGQFQTIAIGPDGEVYDGHQRLNALLTVHGPTYEVAARRASRPLTDEERRKVAIYSRQIGAWDWDKLSAWQPAELMEWGFDADLLKDWKRDTAALDNFLKSEQPEPQDAEPQTDRAAELNEKWQVKTGDLWRIGDHRLLCGDSTKREDVERVMGGERADCVFTSFPYGVGVDYGDTYTDTIEELRKLIASLSVSFLDVVVDGGFSVLNFGDIASGRNIAESEAPCEYPMALEYYPAFRSAGWLLWSRRIWCKPNARVNSLWCIASNRAATDWEHIWTFRKKGEAIIKRVDKSQFGWRDSASMDGVDVGKDEHGAGMPLGIANWMINIHSREYSIVHEPFTGTGTTLVACQNLQRKCRAIEISPNYCAVILERMATAFPGIEIERIE